MSCEPCYVGKGNLDGRGAYAGRDFQPGEIVIRYNWQELSATDWANLPDADKQFVHSFWGRLQLFQSPEKYVNHSDVPNTEPDLGVPGDRAVRLIKRGEAITTNADLEIKNELESLIEVYWQAINKRDFREAARLANPAAEFDFETSKHVGAESIVAGLAAFYRPDLEMSNAKSRTRWLSMSYTAAVCVRILDGREPIKVTTGLNREEGRWQISRQRTTRL